MYNKNKTVIVYLAMNTTKDESYGRDSRSMLEKSLDTLYLNYNNEFKHDIIVFYDNKYPFTESDIHDIRKDRKEIRFQLIPDELWGPPECEEIKNNPNPHNWVDAKFPIGYRNMMRWYGILIYKYLVDLGYEWYMRMDDDSLIHSRIEYDLFKFMYDNQYEYGFRSYCSDHISVSNGLIEFCKEYCDRNDVKPVFLNRYGLNNEISTTRKHNILGYYNNFLISKLSFWMRDDVQKFLHSYDNSGYQYTRRWNDLISQAVTIQIFMDRNKVYHFNDWCYEHTTFGGAYDSKDSIAWGGLYPAVQNAKILSNNYIKKWQNKYNIYHKNTFDTLNVEDCLYKTHTECLSKQLLSPDDTFYNINNDYCLLGKYGDIKNVYLAINDYWINCVANVQRCTQFQYRAPVAFTWFHSESHGEFHKALYAISNKQVLNTIGYDPNIMSFIVSKDLFVTTSQETLDY